MAFYIDKINEGYAGVHKAQLKYNNDIIPRQNHISCKLIALEGKYVDIKIEIVFKENHVGMEEIIVGVVGVLQFDVLKYRLENEYGCEIRLESLPYGFIRWVGNPETDVTKLKRMNNVKAVKDMKGNPLLLFANEWMIKMVLDDNKGLSLLEFKKN